MATPYQCLYNLAKLHARPLDTVAERFAADAQDARDDCAHRASPAQPEAEAEADISWR